MKFIKRWSIAIVAVLVAMMLMACSSEDTSKVVEHAIDEVVGELEKATDEAVEELVNDVVQEKSEQEPKVDEENSQDEINSDIPGIPSYSGEPYVELNNNKPTFKEAELKTKSYETYGKQDELGRCTQARACIGRDIMPKVDRGSIGSVKPSGWKSVKYDIVDGKYLYNRCHLIGYQLTGENANKKNLITGTRYMNVDGMLPFEDMIADYVKETGNHVLYQVIPVYIDDNLVASGVKMEAKSVEDKGKGVCFNVFVYNIQPGVTIDYATGDSCLSEER